MIPGNLKYFIGTFLITFTLFLSFNAQAQEDTQQLEKKKSRLEKSIEYADYLIDDASQKKNATLQDLALIEAKIENRKNLIDNYLQEQNLIFDTIFARMLEINNISSHLSELKNEYARMINSAYRNHNFYKRLVYILSAGDLNQAYSRFNYYKYYARQRNAQISHIREVETQYFGEVENLEAKVEENQQLLESLNREYASLENEMTLKNSILASLTKQVKKLAAEQKRNRRSAEALEQKIQEIVSEEGIDQAMVSASPELVNAPAPVDLELSAGFRDNYGKLPWPLERGIVITGFGEQSHPDLKEVKIKNNGINFLTDEGAVARSVFRGEVTRVLSVPNFNHVVILRHGDFLSVYSNLDEVFVKPGMNISLEQKIGVVHTDGETQKTELHFEIWNGKELQDPTNWITSVKSNESQHQDNP